MRLFTGTDTNMTNYMVLLIELLYKMPECANYMPVQILSVLIRSYLCNKSFAKNVICCGNGMQKCQSMSLNLTFLSFSSLLHIVVNVYEYLKGTHKSKVFF